MEDKAFLKYLLNEDLYMVDDVQSQTEKSSTDTKLEVQKTNVPIVEEPVEKLDAPQVLSYKGENKKGILVLVEDSNNEFLNEKDLEYLLKILGAVNLTLSDIALINVRNVSDYDGLNYDKIMIFTPNHGFELDSDAKYARNKMNEKDFLLADHLSEIADSRGLRNNLWNALKEMFIN